MLHLVFKKKLYFVLVLMFLRILHPKCVNLCISANLVENIGIPSYLSHLNLLAFLSPAVLPAEVDRGGGAQLN